MYCQVCKSFFTVTSKFNELFKNKKLFLCPNCISRYKLKINHLVFPLDKYNVNVIILYERIPLKFTEVFINEYSTIIKQLVKNKHHIILLDIFDEAKLEDYEKVVKILDRSVTFVAFLLKTF